MDWDIVFPRVVQNLLQSKQLFSGAATGSKGALGLDDNFFECFLEIIQEKQRVQLLRYPEQAQSAVVVTECALFLLMSHEVLFLVIIQSHD